MSDFVKDSIPADEMLKTSDVSEALRFLLRVSPACLIPEIVFQRAGETDAGVNVGNTFKRLGGVGVRGLRTSSGDGLDLGEHPTPGSPTRSEDWPPGSNGPAEPIHRFEVVRQLQEV